MSQLFKPKSNYVLRSVIIGGLAALITSIIGAFYFVQRSTYANNVGMIIEQDIPFSHEHHVNALGIDCRFCHTSVETSPFAGMPATETCMKCHQIIWNDSPMLEPVRESFRTGQPLVWKRVYDLPDFVYFDHSIHVQKGVSCQTCHGNVEVMPFINKAAPLYMGWCLRCHEHPGDYVTTSYDWIDKGYSSELQREPSLKDMNTFLAFLEEQKSKAGKKVSPKESLVLINEFTGHLDFGEGRLKQISDCSACHR